MIGSIKPPPTGKDLKSIQIDIHHASKGHSSNFSFFFKSKVNHLIMGDGEKKILYVG